jgi:hypothetical protein
VDSGLMAMGFARVSTADVSLAGSALRVRNLALTEPHVLQSLRPQDLAAQFA